MIISYHPVNPTVMPDSTSFNTFKHQRDAHAMFEFGLHKAWRAHQFLSAFVNSPTVPSSDEEIIIALVKV